MGALLNTVEWKILCAFFEKPTRVYHVKELSRELSISAGSASTLAKRLAQEGFLCKEKKANLLLYSLNNENPVVKKLKTTFFLMKLTNLKFTEKLLEVDSFATIAVYGSHASGEYDEKSDIDILILTRANEKKFIEVMRTLEKELNKEALPTVMKPTEWEKLASKKDAFYNEVTRNHVLLHGVSLVR